VNSYGTSGNLNELLIEIEANLKRAKTSKSLLIREVFTIWYILTESYPCENFKGDELIDLLRRNYSKFKNEYFDDPDYSFILGWMIGRSFWYFGDSIDENLGDILLRKAYKANSNNYLFKWAIRHEVGLSNEEIENLRTQLSVRFEYFYNYGLLIREYFIDVINSRL
jgi:hypothetical protein